MAALTAEQRTALEHSICGHNLIITGQCGTGKTHLLRRIIQDLRAHKRVAVTSTTGMAGTVLGFGATTLHHWSGIGDGRLTELQLGAKFNVDDRFAEAKMRIQDADVLVIDEIGMLSECIFDKLEYVCRLARGNNLVFGGLQVIGTGDFKQLAPVPNYRYHDPGRHVFSSKIFKLVFPHHIHLTTVVRQHEPELIRAVNKLCDGQPDAATEEFIKGLSRPLEDETDLCRLFGTKFDTAYVNQMYLDNHPGEAVTYKSQDEGNTKLLQNSDAEKNLSLKAGAPVILIRNLPGNVYNGLTGKVISAKKDKPPVINFDGRVVTLDRIRFEIYDPELDKVLAVRYQYPVKLAFALTVHRAQGQTKQRIEIDCYSFFAAGQLGVALGRATSSTGIRVLNYNPTAARIQHPKAVYEFNSYKGVPFVDDLECCRNTTPLDHQNNHCNLGYKASNAEDFPTERGDADRMIYNEERSQSNNNAATVECDPGSRNCKWNVEDFISEYPNASFLPPIPHEDFKDILKNHIIFLTEHIDRLMVKQPKGNEDFVTLYKELNDFLTSESHDSVCKRLRECPKAQKMSTKLAYWILKQQIKQLSVTFINKQAEKAALDDMQIETISSSAKSKIRYVAGACIYKILTRLRGIVTRNLGRQHKKSENQRSWNYRMHRLLKSLRISEEQVLNETHDSDSILEIQYRQGQSRGLIHVSDDVFEFFVQLHNFTQKLVTHKAFHLGGDNIHLAVRGKVFNNQELLSAWMGLFSVNEDDNNDDDTFNSMVVELFELVAEHFMRITIIEGLHSFKTAVPRKKKQALRSKVTALSERKGTGASSQKVKNPAAETLFFCPACNEECKEEPERCDENSIGCDVCNNWYHFKCVALTGKEKFIHQENYGWKCSDCLQRGKGRGKKLTR